MSFDEWCKFHYDEGVGMITNVFHVSEEAFKSLPLQDRFITEILDNMVNADFYSGVRHIIEDSYPEGVYYYDFTEDDKITMDHFKANLESAIHCYVTLLYIYRSEFGDTKELEETLKLVSKGLAEKQIEAFGWNKRKYVGREVQK